MTGKYVHLKVTHTHTHTGVQRFITFTILSVESRAGLSASHKAYIEPGKDTGSESVLRVSGWDRVCSGLGWCGVSLPLSSNEGEPVGSCLNPHVGRGGEEGGLEIKDLANKFKGML